MTKYLFWRHLGKYLKDLPSCSSNILYQIYIIPGKAQKGHLAFEATFESANLGKVDFVQVLAFLFISGRSLLAKVPLPLALPQAIEAGNLSRSLLALSNGTKQRGALILSPIFRLLIVSQLILSYRIISIRTQNMTSTSAQILAIPDTGEV